MNVQRISDLERKYVNQVLDHGFQSSFHHQFNHRVEQLFSDKMQGGYAITMTNGTSTMHAALMALGIGPGDEVIVPPLTMGSTSLCVLHAGAKPVYADILPDTFLIDAQSVEQRITSRTKAVISVGLYGLLPEYDDLLAVCSQHGLALIEDNAECIGAAYHGRQGGGFGVFASYSFQASKHLTCGEGGLLFTHSETLANKARQAAVLGYPVDVAAKGHLSEAALQEPDFIRHTMVGFNYRMPELCAAVILAQLERSEELIECRIRSAECYQEALQGCSWLFSQRTPDYCRNTFWTFAVLGPAEWTSKDRQDFRNCLKASECDSYYAAWRLNYREPLGLNVALYSQLCPIAESIQPRLMQFKTNYWRLDDAKRQAEALHRAWHQMQSMGAS